MGAVATGVALAEEKSSQGLKNGLFFPIFLEFYIWTGGV